MVHAGQIFMHVWITYRRKRAFLSLCSFPWSSRPHIRTCRNPPAGNTGFPRHRWLSSCLLSWGRGHHPLSSSLWMVLGCEKRRGQVQPSEVTSVKCKLFSAKRLFRLSDTTWKKTVFPHFFSSTKSIKLPQLFITNTT